LTAVIGKVLVYALAKAGRTPTERERWLIGKTNFSELATP
jgi:hypothetical protein